MSGSMYTVHVINHVAGPVRVIANYGSNGQAYNRVRGFNPKEGKIPRSREMKNPASSMYYAMMR